MLTPQPVQKVVVVDIQENPAVTQVLVVAVAAVVQKIAKITLVVLVGQDILLGTKVVWE